MTPKVMLGFDMETDIGSWTPFCEGVVHGTPRILEVLGQHAIDATFYFVADELFPIPGMMPILPHECRPRIQMVTEIVSKVVGKKMASFRAFCVFRSQLN